MGKTTLAEPKQPRLYGRRWGKARLAHLTANPFCVMCAEEGRIVVATVVDHIIPHRGDPELFWDPDNWQSLCEHHHNSVKRIEETGGTVPGCNADGTPMDRNHHWRTGEAPDMLERLPLAIMFPSGLGRSAIPLTIVCGPPAGGKSTYVAAHAAPGDIVIDLDDIIAETEDTNREVRLRARRRGLEERNARLAQLATYKGPAKAAWFITTAPAAGTRRKWADMLKPAQVLVLATPEDICIDRVRQDPQRRAVFDLQRKIIRRWWRDYYPWRADTLVAQHVETGGGSKV